MIDPTTLFTNDDDFLTVVREYFHDDTFAFKTIGMEIVAAADGHGLVRMPLGDHLFNAKGEIQGGALFSMADLVAGIADFQPGNYNVTVDGSIQYLSVPKGSSLFAHAYRMRRGRTMGYYRVDITDDTNKLVAAATFTYYHRPMQA